MANRTPADSRFEHWRWRIFGITWLTYFGFYFTRKSFSVAKIGMGQDETLGAANYTSAEQHLRKDDRVGLMDGDMAMVDTANLVAYAIGQFIWGMAGDRFGTRWVVLFGLCGSVAAAVWMGASSLAVMFAVFFCLQGAFQATGWAPLAKNVGNFFARHERGVVFGIWSTNYAFGGLVASAFAGWCGDRYGWRYAFFIPAGVVAAIAVLFWLLQRNRPEDVGLEPVEVYHNDTTDETINGAPAQAEGSWRAIWDVIANPNVLLLGFVYFLLKPTRYAILYWGPKYVNSKLGTNMTESGLMSGLFEFAGIGSVFAAGYLSDRVFGSRRMPICILSLFALGAFLLVFDHLPAEGIYLGGGFVLIGLLLFGPDSIIAGVAAADFGTKRGTSTACGWINGWGSVGAVIGGTIPGYTQYWGWDGIFAFLGGLVLLAGILLLPKWNARPMTQVVKSSA
jgi:sugar phosphate permease